ncbi:hypothetical protein HNR27_003016 [Ornithinibacillus bavariensis]
MKRLLASMITALILLIITQTPIFAEENLQPGQCSL